MPPFQWETSWHSWASLGRCLGILWGHCSFLLDTGVHKVLFVPSKSLFIQSFISSVIKSHWPPKSNSLGALSPFARSQVGKSVVGPRTFLTVWEFLWYNCSAVCSLSAQSPYGGVNGDLLQEGLCHRLCDQISCTQRSRPCSRPLLTSNTGDTQTQFWLSLCGVSGSWCTQGFVWALWASLAVWGLILNVI